MLRRPLVSGNLCSTKDQPMNRLLELSNVPGPWVRLKPLDHIMAELDVSPISTVEVLQKERGEDGDLFGPFSQRRDANLDGLKAVDPLPELVVGSGRCMLHSRSYESHVEVDPFASRETSPARSTCSSLGTRPRRSAPISSK